MEKSKGLAIAAGIIVFCIAFLPLYSVLSTPSTDEPFTPIGESQQAGYFMGVLIMSAGGAAVAALIAAFIVKKSVK
jgi:hypothetical protein